LLGRRTGASKLDIHITRLHLSDTMIIKSWNCTGLPNKLKSTTLSQWLKDADIAAFQETFLDTTALQVAGFSPYVKCAKPAPAGKRHRPTGGLVVLVSSQLSSIYNVSSIECFNVDGLENQCLLFERSDDARADLPASFIVLNCYVVFPSRPFSILAPFISCLRHFFWDTRSQPWF
jgi:hypothetical protein